MAIVTTLDQWAGTNIDGSMHPVMFRQFADSILSLCAEFGLQDALEIGGGRSPLFDPSDFEAVGSIYHINDIEQGELDLAPDSIPPERRICFDIAAADLTPHRTYDLVYSKSVFEHVKGTHQAWINTYNLLRPGGVALHFFPTFYCPPFVANRILPEWLSERILSSTPGFEYKKFPALYDGCRSTDRQRRRIESVGFSEVTLVPFWGHAYFNRIPVLRGAERWLTAQAAGRGVRSYTSYCYALARK
jgi:SAM-dependent methyltransferase